MGDTPVPESLLSSSTNPSVILIISTGLMAPNLLYRNLVQRSDTSAISLESLSNAVATNVELQYLQWHNPTEILSVLLLWSPETVQQAVAQLSGRAITPVAFSFGWVAFAAKSLLAVFGGGPLMPQYESGITVVGVQSGHSRITNSWILGRLLRDITEDIDREMRKEQAHIRPSQKSVAGNTGGKPWEALRVAIFRIHPPAKPKIDWLWLSGVAVILTQLIIAIIPWTKDGDWMIFVIAACGNVLAVTAASLPQWSKEKWPASKTGGDTVTMTEGNGSRLAVVLLKCPGQGRDREGAGYDIEILARSTRFVQASRTTRSIVGFLSLLWIGFLVGAAAIKQNTWYLLLIGALGSAQNVLVAAVSRSSAAHGFNLELVRTISGSRVAQVLKESEEYMDLLGTSLVPIFFPGGLRVKDDDVEFWRRAREKRLQSNQWGTRVDQLPLKFESEAIVNSTSTGQVSGPSTA